MRSLITFFIFVLIVSSVEAQLKEIPKQVIPADYGYIVKIGQQMPEIVMVLTDGKKVTTTDLKGKAVMLQFTASWCSVCRK